MKGKLFTLIRFLKPQILGKMCKYNSSEFEELLHKIISKKLFIFQEISYINMDGEMKLSTVSNYIKAFLGNRN